MKRNTAFLLILSMLAVNLFGIAVPFNTAAAEDLLSVSDACLSVNMVDNLIAVSGISSGTGVLTILFFQEGIEVSSYPVSVSAGNFYHEIIIENLPSGEYTVMMKQGEEVLYEEAVSLISADERKAFENKLLAAVMANDVYAVWGILDELPLYFQYYSILSDRSAAARLICENECFSIAEINRIIELEALNQNCRDVYVMPIYRDINTFDKAWDLYSGLREPSKVDYMMFGQGFKTLDEAARSFYEASFLCAINGVESYKELEVLLMEHRDLLRLDLSEYNQLGGRKAEVLKRMAACVPYHEIYEVSRIFSSAVKANQPGNSSGGGGSSGGTDSDDFEISDVIMSFKVNIKNPEKGGMIIAAVYEGDDRLAESKSYPVSASVDVEIDKPGSYVKIMRWNMGTLQPMSSVKMIPIP